MKIIPSFVFLLLFTQKIPWVDGDCFYHSPTRHCSCSLVDLTNIMSIVSCIQASSFEFQGGSFVDTTEYLSYSVEMEQVLAMIHLPLTKISFVNVELSEAFLSTFIKWVFKIPINELAFENTTFIGNSSWQYMNGSSPYISFLRFINVSSYSLLDRTADFSYLGDWISKLKEITLEKSHLTSIPCNISLLFKTLSSLDLSENVLQDKDISTSFCQGAFPKLEILKLRHNSLINYETICHTISEQQQLRHLDLSQNNILCSSSSVCEWQPSLVLLNLSNAGIEYLQCNLPKNCAILDLSYNMLTTLNISLPKLKELFLSYNRFSTISTTSQLPILQVLSIDWNPIKTIQRGQLQFFKQLNIFSANNNLYTCSCSFVHEMNEIANSGLKIQNWPDGYTCESPVLLSGKLVSEANLSFFECHKTLLIVVISFVILLIFMAIIICFVKINRSTKARSQNRHSGNLNSVHFHS
ncbi:toll-like receptor 2 [Bombina bombina]|uniref:toll-like receptor 2 n=1 Tax=Bombina bombina TaxID=8345 RepID=UPI00235AB3C7|nr:toll-like receptor 2 [Bombina bombina]